MDAIDRDIIVIGLSLGTENIDADLSFMTFLRLFCRVFGVQAPLKKIIKKKDKRENQTMGHKKYIKSISFRNKLHKQFTK